MRTDGIAERLVAAWRAPYVARSHVGEFSGGLYSPKTLANADAAKQGPPGAIRVGKRKVAYPTESLAIWIAEKSIM